MFKFSYCLTAAALLLAVCTTAIESATEKVYRCSFDAAQASSVIGVVETLDLDLWSHQTLPRDSGVSSFVDVRVSNAEEERSALTAIQNLAKCELLIGDLTVVAEAQQLEAIYGSVLEKQKSRLDAEGIDPFFSNYRSYDDINEKLADLADSYPDLASIFTLNGVTWENRTIKGLVLTSNVKSYKDKPVIYFNGGIHAREWISSATVMYLLYRFLSTYSSDTLSKYILDNMQIVATPLSNPDGYEFTRTPGNRWWRKNRRLNPDGSYGVDLNRNWDEHFGRVGVSRRYSSEIYPGPSAFSEPETQMLSRFISSLPNKIGGIDFHSYGQLVLRNWGWTVRDSQNEVVLKELGASIVDTIKKTSESLNRKLKKSIAGGRQPSLYQNVKGANLYPASGATDDWMSATQGMTAFTIELSPADGRYGFALPSSEIVNVGEEIFKAMQVFCLRLFKEKIPPNAYVRRGSWHRNAWRRFVGSN